MTSRASGFLAVSGRAVVVAMSIVGAACVGGCDALDSETPITCDGGTSCTDGAVAVVDAGQETGRCAAATSPLTPPQNCGPNDEATPPNCMGDDAVKSCPTSSPCMARVPVTGTTTTLRVGKFRLWSPDALLSLQSLIVDPLVNPSCFNGGADSYNWILKVDTAANTITMGGSNVSKDGGTTYQFLNSTVDSANYATICPGFVGNGTTFQLQNATTSITFDSTGNTFSSNSIDTINMPIFNGDVPLVLPLHNAVAKNVTLSGDKSCIGSWTQADWCGAESAGWTTGGTFLAQITLDDADNIPVQQTGCSTLCSLLVNDPSKQTADGKACKKDGTGHVPAYGDTCVGGTGCNNAFWLSATFAAYEVTVLDP